MPNFGDPLALGSVEKFSVVSLIAIYSLRDLNCVEIVQLLVKIVNN